MTPITPTPGRIVWYWPAANDGIPASNINPLSAVVAAVHDDRHVNLCVFDHYGLPHSRTNVFLSQPDQERPTSREYAFAEWMPYQKGQAAKTEQLAAVVETAIAAGVGDTTPAMFAEVDGTSASLVGLVNTDAPAAAEPAVSSESSDSSPSTDTPATTE